MHKLPWINNVANTDYRLVWHSKSHTLYILYLKCFVGYGACVAAQRLWGHCCYFRKCCKEEVTRLLGRQRSSIDRRMRRKQRMREVALIRVNSALLCLFLSAIHSCLICIVCCINTAALFSSLSTCLFLSLPLGFVSCCGVFFEGRTFVTSARSCFGSLTHGTQSVQWSIKDN